MLNVKCRMKSGFLKFCILHFAFCFAAFGATTQDIPSAFPASRYEPLIKSLPFALATPVAAVAAPGFAANMYLTGVAKIGSQNFVTIATRDQPPAHFSLTPGETADGISLVSVEWSEAVGKSKATIKKGTEFATLEFDQATMLKPPLITPQPQQMPQRPVISPRANQPLLQPGVQQIQRTNQPLQPNARVIVPPAGPQGPAVRQRVRVPPINSNPQ
jgi:hypothetical protein